MRSARTEIERQLTQAREERDYLFRQLEVAKRRWSSLKKKVVDQQWRDRSARRVVRFSSRARERLVVFRQQVLERNIARIERLVLESFQQLLRKGRAGPRTGNRPGQSCRPPLRTPRALAASRQTLCGRTPAIGGLPALGAGARFPPCDPNHRGHAVGTPRLRAQRTSGDQVLPICQPPGRSPKHRRGDRGTVPGPTLRNTSGVRTIFATMTIRKPPKSRRVTSIRALSYDRDDSSLPEGAGSVDPVEAPHRHTELEHALSVGVLRVPG